MTSKTITIHPEQMKYYYWYSQQRADQIEKSLEPFDGFITALPRSVSVLPNGVRYTEQTTKPKPFSSWPDNVLVAEIPMTEEEIQSELEFEKVMKSIQELLNNLKCNHQ